MEAVYDLKHFAASFDIADFLCGAKTRGADRVVFDDTHGYSGKYSPEKTRQRMQSILEPACALADMPYRYGQPMRDAMHPPRHISAPIRAWEEFKRIEKLRSVLPPASVDYTVTLRNSLRETQRNSNSVAWRKFAARIGAVVIEDYTEVAIGLHERMAMYAGAKMNFVTNGGPARLLVLSDYPYTLFMNAPHTQHLIAHGWLPGTQPKWANADQVTIWSDDTDENIMNLTLQ